MVVTMNLPKVLKTIQTLDSKQQSGVVFVHQMR
jgi:hypothetical protein